MHETIASAKPKPGIVFSGAPRGRRYDSWREEFCRQFCQLDVAPTTADNIECTVEVSRVGSLSLSTAHGSFGSFFRSPAMLIDGCDDLCLLTAVEGGLVAIQRGRSIELQPSQMCLLSFDDIGESRLQEGGRYTALRLPRRDLMAVCRNVEDKLATPLVENPALRNIVGTYFDLCTNAAPGLDITGQHAMARHLTELVGLVADTVGGGPPRGDRDGYAAARLRLVQARVLENLHDGALTIAGVARRAGMSPKQVQRLFEPTGSTFSEFVLEERLKLAGRLLVREHSLPEKIASIAYDSGFNDLSYFNRSFRRRFGMTPSEWRRDKSAVAS